MLIQELPFTPWLSAMVIFSLVNGSAIDEFVFIDLDFGHKVYPFLDCKLIFAIVKHS